MKKIFTLFFALGMIAVAQAQPGNRDNRDNRDIRQPDTKVIVVDHRDNGYDNNNIRYDDRFSNDRKRDWEINRINKEYDYKIQQVKRSFYLFRGEKQRQIRMLEAQRDQEIRMVMYKYSDKRGRRDDHPDRRY